MDVTFDGPVVGRREELQTIDGLLAAVRGGTGAGLVLEGEPGIGKSRLLAELVRRASGFGCTIVTASVDELDAHRPFGALLELASLDEEALVSRTDVDAPGFLTYRLEQTLFDCVESASTRGPVVVAVDDVHWADPLSVAGLHSVATAVAELPVLLVASTRLVPRRPELTTLLDAIAARGARLTVGPLDDRSTDTLLRTLVAAEPGASLRRQASCAGGNPLYLIELVAALREEGAIQEGAGGTVEVTTVITPPSLRFTILHRLSSLAPATLDALSVAAVVGATFTAAELAAATGRRVGELAASIREALGAGILREEEGGLTFRHDLIRQALYDELPQSVREALHAELGHVLLHDGQDASAAAAHLRRAGRDDDVAAARELAASAREVMVGAPAAAIELLQSARSLCNDREAAAEGIDADLAIALLWDGQIEQGEAWCRRVLLDPAVVADREALHLSLAEALLERGLIDDARREVDAFLRADYCNELRARVAAFGAFVDSLVGDLAAAEAVSSELLAGEVDAATRCQALLTLSHVESRSGRLGAAVERSSEAVALAEADPTRELHRPLPHLTRAVFLLAAGRVEEARADLERGRRMCEGIGCRNHMPIYDVVAGQISMLAGAWSQAELELQTALERGSTIDTSWTNSAHVVRALMAAHGGELAEASTRLEAVDRAGPPADLERCWATWCQALLLEGTEGAASAVDHLRDSWTDVLGPPAGAGAAAMAVRICLAAGATDLAETFAATLDLMAEGAAGQPAPAAMAQWARGLLARDADDVVEAMHVLEDAQLEVAAAQAGEDAAVLLAGAGRTDEARELGHRVLEAYQRIGARRDARRTERRLRDAKVRLGVRGTRQRPVDGWAALTPTEAQVAELAAAGLTNAQIAAELFVSRHTVHTHMRHVLGKLGLSTRAGLVAFRDLAEPR